MPPASLEGQTLGKYRVLEPLGRGGMARVYRAYHPQLDRYVALKVLRSDLLEEEGFLTRFQREARAVAALRHPNIVQVFDSDVQDDVYYMVLELLEGDTLKARLNDYRTRGERMPLGEIVRILLDVLDGLAYAHSEGMIHRDVKPANILLTKRGQAVITDFGIAQIVGGTRHTATGALMGTLNYIAPEQGLRGHSDARSDIYSLGIVFYEMLTQRTPFEADTPLAVLMKHVNDPLPLPRKIAPTIPEPFERIVLKALAKNPDDRYQSAEEMAQALREAAEEAEIELPSRISLPLSFTTAEAPSESVAVLSGTAREKITDAQFAEDDTDTTLGQRLAAEGVEREQDLGRARKELLSAMGTVAHAAVSQAAKALRGAAGAAADKPPETPGPKDALPGTSLQELPGAQPAAEGVEEERTVGKAGKELLSAVGAVANVALSHTVKALHEAAEAIESESPEELEGVSSSALSDELPEAQFADEDAGESPGQPLAAECCAHVKPGRGRIVRAILGAIGIITICNSMMLVVSAPANWWALYEHGWPTQLFLVSLGLCIVMWATSSIWMLVPTGIVSGTGVLLTYSSLTGNWDQWIFLWFFQLWIVVGSVAIPILLAKQKDKARKLSRLFALLIGIPSVALIPIIASVAMAKSLLFG